MHVGDCFIRPALGGRSRSIWKIVSIEGNQCHADLYDFGEQGIYHYINEPFGQRRFSTFIPAPIESYKRVTQLYDDALLRAQAILKSSLKQKTEHVEFGTCLYSESPGYQGVLKLIAQSGDNGMLCDYIHISNESLSRETIRPGICSLSQYEDDESKMSIDPTVYDKLNKIITMTCISVQAMVNRIVNETKNKGKEF